MHFLQDHESGFFSGSEDSDCFVATSNKEVDTGFGLLSTLFVNENADEGEDEGVADPSAAV